MSRSGIGKGNLFFPTRNSNLLFFPSSHERHVLACQIPPPLPPLKPAKQASLLKRLNKLFHYHYFIFLLLLFLFLLSPLLNKSQKNQPGNVLFTLQGEFHYDTKETFSFRKKHFEYILLLLMCSKSCKS